MSAEIAVRTRLLATSAVTALVSTRVYLMRLPDPVTFPAIRVQLVDDPQMKHLRGPLGITGARVQVDVYDEETATDPYGSVNEISQAVEAALVFAPFSAGTVYVQSAERIDRRALREAEELELVRMMQDFRVWSHVMS